MDANWAFSIDLQLAIPWQRGIHSQHVLFVTGLASLREKSFDGPISRYEHDNPSPLTYI